MSIARAESLHPLMQPVFDEDSCECGMRASASNDLYCAQFISHVSSPRINVTASGEVACVHVLTEAETTSIASANVILFDRRFFLTLDACLTWKMVFWGFEESCEL